MDTEKVEADAIDIDILDTIDHSDVIIIPEGTERTDSEYLGDAIPVSEDNALKTGNLIKQFFNLISQFKNKEYWKLNEEEIKSLNKVCPKVLPDVISKHSGLVTCILNILGIIIKRLKMEQQNSLNYKEPKLDDSIDKSDEPIQEKSLTGGRTS